MQIDCDNDVNMGCVACPDGGMQELGWIVSYSSSSQVMIPDLVLNVFC
jgi:hypothetical protein